jgi:hypothetical protein
LGYFREGVEACAEECLSTPECGFIHYDPNDGECLSVLTSSAACPEGLE